MSNSGAIRAGEFLKAIRSFGNDGTTIEEIAVVMGWHTTTARDWLREFEQIGVLERCGWKTHKGTGRQRRAWCVSQQWGG
jgi:DNA-binding IclR family transcriptional regulator